MTPPPEIHMPADLFEDWDETQEPPDWVEDVPAARKLAADVAEAEADEENTEGRKIVLKAASGMKMTRVRWLQGQQSGGLIPLGAITLLAGREGIGKSTITYDVIAKVTTGKLRGEFYGTPKGVIIYATEDDWEPVILPRLVAAGADVERVYRAEAEEDGMKSWISFPRDLVRLAAQCKEKDVALLVIDPIMSIIDGKLDTHKDREVREALDPLSRFAAAVGAAVIGLIHVNKSGGTDPLNSVMGSRAFTAVARSVLYCIKVHRTDDEAGPDEFLYSQEKCNLGPKQTSQRYTIEQVELPAVDDDGNDFKVTTSRVLWGLTDVRRATDVMEEANKVVRQKGNLRQEILTWLTEKDDITPVKEVIEQFEANAKAGTIKVTLGRMVDAGEIERPVNGMYRAHRKSTE